MPIHANIVKNVVGISAPGWTHLPGIEFPHPLTVGLYPTHLRGRSSRAKSGTKATHYSLWWCYEWPTSSHLCWIHRTSLHALSIIPSIPISVLQGEFAANTASGRKISWRIPRPTYSSTIRHEGDENVRMCRTLLIEYWMVCYISKTTRNTNITLEENVSYSIQTEPAIVSIHARYREKRAFSYTSIFFDPTELSTFSPDIPLE